MRWARFPIAIIGCLVLQACSGFGSSERYTIQSRGESGVRLVTTPTVAAWQAGSISSSIILSELTIDDLLDGNASGVIVHIDLYWSPRPGRTPIDPTATNFALRVLVLSDGEVGLYGGGGFGWPSIDEAAGTISLDVTGCSFSLLERTGGFKDLLTPGELRGEVTARRAD
ncbi:MAG: hypothetical protein O2819_09530, partial [Planctomycetota bacterium]|nr:hypothetical protein [Planctomycetota bacterium]